MNGCEREGKEGEEEGGRAVLIPEKEMLRAAGCRGGVIGTPGTCTGETSFARLPDLQGKLPVFLPPLHSSCSNHTKGYILIALLGILPIANPPRVPL